MSGSKQNNSDRAMARLLADALRPVSGTAGELACPDPELLAAYAEHNLDSNEIAHWDEHFAGCARCQKILAVLAVSSDQPLSESEVERFGRLAAVRGADKLPEAPSAAQKDRPRRDRDKVTPIVRPGTAWRWVAPAIGIAAAAALWIALRPPPFRETPAITAQKTTDQSSASAPTQDQNSDSLMARANVPAPPSTAARETESRQLKALPVPELQKKENQEPSGVPQAPSQSAPEAGGAAAALQAEKALQARATPVPQLAPDAKAPAAPGPRATDEVSAAAVPASRLAAPAAAPARAQVDAPANALADATAAKANAPVVEGKTAESKAADSKTPETRPLEAFAARAGVAGRLAGNNVSVVFAAPNLTVLWRLVNPAARIERSTDQGQTWQQQSTGVTSELLAGAAPSERVAWVVGRSGVILRTTDGEHWQKVASPAAATDWTGIEASDALHATVIAADGSRFTTESGGQTWTQQ